MNWLCWIVGILVALLPVCAAIIGGVLAIATGERKAILYWWAKATAYYIVGLPVVLAGLPLVAIGIPFRQEYFITTWRPFTQYPADPGWQLVRLPAWLPWWDNPFDGLWGDRRGWWNHYCQTNYGKTCAAAWSMWQWAAIRNSANYYSRVLTGCDVSRCVIRKIAGADLADEDNPGWQFLEATRDDGARFHLVQFCLPWWFDRKHALFGRFGWKLKLEYNGMTPLASEADRVQGSVYRMTPWKAI